jgi:integrative and conjugative element protein (TIGR02256 family)
MSREVIYQHPWMSKGLILIEDSVLSVIGKYLQDNPNKTEAGGILIGYRRGAHLHVIEATTPLPLDRRSWCQFHRLDPGHQKIALTRWEESGHELDYLGEWHTHPEHYPTPSGIDKTEWAKLYRGSDQPLVFLIVGITGNRWLSLGWKSKDSPLSVVL